MRTKTLLLTAALGIASAASSMAQAVYSVNIVGYVNLTLRPGFNLVANQLDATPNNQLSSVFPSVPDGSQVLKFRNNNYTVYQFFSGFGGWIDESFQPANATVDPGEGFFFTNPNASDLTVTTVGQVRTGNNLTVTLDPNTFTLISSITPQDLTLDATSNYPLSDGVQYLSWNANANPQTYNPILQYFSGFGGWIDESFATVPAPVTRVGQGWFHSSPSPTAVDWSRNFNPNQ
jgi:hypothetical protein